MTTWRDLGDRVDELWSDDFEVLHWVVSAKRLPVSDLADSPASDTTTTPTERRPMEVSGG